MEIKTKQVTEFGQSVTLYRVVNTETGKGTLWHSTEERALAHYQRHYGSPPVDWKNG
jgi:hypothetical protein